MRPRIGFVGVGWIGRNRLEAVAAADVVDVVAVADAAPGLAPDVASPHACEVRSTAEVLGARDLDGVVIATPSALHADQTMAALASGLAVFCQKPLGRSAAECIALVAAARDVDRLLDVDLSYRHVEAVRRARDAVASGEIGEAYATDLVFHNAYGPDKAWYRDLRLAGGGCVMDLGIHLVDLALWVLDGPKVVGASSRLFAEGRPVGPGASQIEDHAVGRLDLADGGTVTVSCSWNLHAGCDAVIGATFHGTTGSVGVHNIGGSFYDFTTVLHRGTSTSVLFEGSDEWGGRAAVHWARRLAGGGRFDPSVASVVDVALALDALYGRAP